MTSTSCVAAALWFWGPDGAEHHLLAFMTVVLFCARFGGFLVGLATTATSLLLSSYLFMEPIYSLRVDSLRDWSWLGLAAVQGVAVSWLFGRHRALRAEHESTVASLRQAQTAAKRSEESLRAIQADLLRMRHTIARSVAPSLATLSDPDEGRTVARIGRFLEAVEQYGTGGPRQGVRHIRFAKVLARVAAELDGDEGKLRNRLQHPPVLPVVAVRESDLRCVLRETLSNAFRVSPEDAPVRIECTQQGDFWRFTVSDSGPGMIPLVSSRVFTLFGDSEGSDAGHAGLAIARRTVQVYGGDMRLTSIPGGGTTVYFTLPAKN